MAARAVWCRTSQRPKDNHEPSPKASPLAGWRALRRTQPHRRGHRPRARERLRNPGGRRLRPDRVEIATADHLAHNRVASRRWWPYTGDLYSALVSVADEFNHMGATSARVRYIDITS